MDASDDAEMTRMWNAGKTLAEIAARFGMTNEDAYARINLLRRYGGHLPRKEV